MRGSESTKEPMDWPLLVLSAALLVAMGLATLYGFKYGNVDETVMPGYVCIKDNGATRFALRVDDDLDAEAFFNGVNITGHLTLDGAEKDTILYRFTKIEVVDDEQAMLVPPAEQVADSQDAEREPAGSTSQDSVPPEEMDSSGVILLVRVPRSGLTGNHVGPWMMYYVYQPTDETVSDWVFLQEDGTALLGTGEIANPMTAMRDQLLAKTTSTTWTSEGNTITLAADAA